MHYNVQHELHLYFDWTLHIQGCVVRVLVETNFGLHMCDRTTCMYTMLSWDPHIGFHCIGVLNKV